MRGYSTDAPLPSPLQVVDSPRAASEAGRHPVAHDKTITELERVKFVMKGGQVFKRTEMNGDIP